MKKILFLPLLMVLAMTSCSKENIPPKEIEGPVQEPLEDYIAFQEEQYASPVALQIVSDSSYDLLITNADTKNDPYTGLWDFALVSIQSQDGVIVPGTYTYKPETATDFDPAKHFYAATAGIRVEVTEGQADFTTGQSFITPSTGTVTVTQTEQGYALSFALEFANGQVVEAVFSGSLITFTQTAEPLQNYITYAEQQYEAPAALQVVSSASYDLMITNVDTTVTSAYSGLWDYAVVSIKSTDGAIVPGTYTYNSETATDFDPTKHFYAAKAGVQINVTDGKPDYTTGQSIETATGGTVTITESNGVYTVDYSLEFDTQVVKAGFSGSVNSVTVTTTEPPVQENPDNYILFAGTKYTTPIALQTISDTYYELVITNENTKTNTTYTGFWDFASISIKSTNGVIIPGTYTYKPDTAPDFDPTKHFFNSFSGIRVQVNNGTPDTTTGDFLTTPVAGTVTIAEEGGVYTLSYDLEYDGGKTIKSVFSGTLDQ